MMRRFQSMFFVLILICLLAVPAYAQDEETPPPTEATPQVVQIGVYVVGTSEFNLDTGTYNVDFYLTMHCSVECTDEAVGFDIVGINGTESLAVEERLRQPQYAEYRIQAVLNQNIIDLSRYPFDRHNLNIIIESKFLQTDALSYEVREEETGVDEGVQLQGWDLSDAHSVTITEKSYYGQDAGYPRYTFTMNTERVALAAFIRSILPALVILFISFIGTFLPDRNNRVGLAGGILLAMLLHHLAVSAEIPPVGYPVYFDAFMLLNDAAILLQFASTVYELVREKNEVPDAVLNRFSYISLLVIVIVWLLGQFILWQMFIS